MYKLCFYVPETHLEPVKQAIFAAGGGKIGAYDSCCWQTLGTGQFRPLAGADPFIGHSSMEEPGKIESVPEYKVELVCDDANIEAAVASLKRVHPYEEPAYQVWPLAPF